jgi:hypothetical protein
VNVHKLPVHSARTPSAGAWLALAAWFAVAVVVGAVGLLARLPVPPPAIAGALTFALLITIAFSSTIRAHVRSFGLRSFVIFHLTRVAAGAYFLVLYRRGALPAEFALPAGWGLSLLAWNTFGLLDILFVLSTGVRLFLGEPAIMASFTRLPLALLPAFVVPIVLVTHVLVFIWWRDARAAER